MSELTVRVNGAERRLPAGATVADLVAELPSTKGIAVAVDGEVVRRAEWGGHALSAGARIEIVTAVQGG